MEPLLEGREPPSVCSRGVQTEPLQHQRKQANRKTKVSRLPPHSQFVRSRILPLLRSDDVYLDADYEEKHGIVFRRMDIFTGKTRDPETGVVDETSEVFTQLYPWEAMNQAIEGNKPWIDSNDSMEWHLKDEWYGSHDDWWKAKRTGNILQRYLSCDHMDMVEGVIGDTDWETYYPPSDWKLERWDDFARWCVTSVWKQNIPDHPHLTCFLINLDPLRDDRLSTAEMRTVLTMSGAWAGDKGHENRTRIPVTVISSSGQKLRVLVGIVDSTKGTIEVRRSDIIDFSEGERANWKEWITVLCWIVGEPSGKTD